MIKNEALIAKRREKANAANDIFANIISKENIRMVRSMFASTASFSPATRVLKLPTLRWGLPNFVDEGRIIHEVGHALFTSNAMMDKFKKELAPKGVPFSFVNIFEDVRINKLMARKFKGVKVIHNVYYEFMFDDSFFGKAEDIKNYSFVDLVNVYYKVGKYSGIKLKEHVAYEIFGARIETLETEDDVLELSQDVYEHFKSDMEKEKSESKTDIDNEPNEDEGEVAGNTDAPTEAGNDETAEAENEEEGAGADNNAETEENEDTATGTGDETLEDGAENEDDNAGADSDNKGDEAEDEAENETGNGAGLGDGEKEDDAGKPNELEAGSNDKFDAGMSDLVEDLQNMSEDDASVNNIRIAEGAYKNIIKDFGNIITKSWPVNNYPNYSFIDAVWSPLMTKVKPIVNAMVANFEQKKAASDFARTATSDSGSLDITKLHLYRITDDIFLKNAYTPEGKSHGITILLDSSGSMQGEAYLKVIKQSIIMCMFAKRVGIPFSVVQFTDGDYNISKGGEVFSEEEAYLNTSSLDMVELINSDLKSFEMVERMQKMYEFAYSKGCTEGFGSITNAPSTRSHAGRRAYDINASMPSLMHCTPIEQATLVMADFIKDFKAKHKIEINTFVILTDGGSGGFTLFGRKRVANGDNFRVTFDSSNKSYTAKLEERAPRFVTMPYGMVGLETGSNVVELSIDNFSYSKNSSKQIAEYTQRGFYVSKKTDPGVSLKIDYKSDMIGVELDRKDANGYADEITKDLMTKAMSKKIDVLFGKLIADIIAKSM